MRTHLHTARIVVRIMNKLKEVREGWRNWKKYSVVFCDRRLPMKLKGKLYKNSYQTSDAVWSRGMGIQRGGQKHGMR